MKPLYLPSPPACTRKGVRGAAKSSSAQLPFWTFLQRFQLNCWSVCLLGCYVFAPTFAFKMNWDFQNKRARGGEGKRPRPPGLTHREEIIP